MKLTISRKLLFGYLFMAFLTVLASAYALYSLQKLNRVAYNMTSNQFEVMDKSQKMLDILLAQESAEKKYLILKDPELEKIFWQRSQEFREEISSMRKYTLDQSTKIALAETEKLQNRFRKLFSEEVLLTKDDRLPEAQALSDDAGRETVDDMAKNLHDIRKHMDQSINDEMNQITRQGRLALHMTTGLSVLSLILGISLALIITRNISKPLKQLQNATRMIAEGRLDHQIEARRDDEIGDLAKSFAYMTGRLKVLEALNLDASPLTGLPGNLAIEQRIDEELNKKRAFSLCQVDLDNFKPFADKYGYAWGSEVIKEVANLLQEYIREPELSGIFIGHIGGDDYVAIGNPEDVRTICQRLVKDFEGRIFSFYGEEDARNGYFVGKNRQGTLHKFPLITVTAAIVTDDGSRFKNSLDMARRVAELKEFAKTLSGSNYVTEDDIEKMRSIDVHNSQHAPESEQCS
ncbi:MAG: HAMP domain-containing protein [Syntrophaceae bacterium]|nr:HAMP domain-containing protein [Syntrophaceae bacterium]HOC60237.1 HAMP domain-containing protein [Smithellaceae bacterium]HQM45009.1 HAMP domain-containing protein [Smithellaceae bacterium]